MKRHGTEEQNMAKLRPIANMILVQMLLVSTVDYLLKAADMFQRPIFILESYSIYGIPNFSISASETRDYKLYVLRNIHHENSKHDFKHRWWVG